MEEATARKVRFLALQVVGAVAVVHLVVGVAELVRLANAGLLGAYVTGEQALAQPEPWLFTLSALAVLGGVVAVASGHLGYRRAYLLGIAMMATYVLGWVAWHTVLEHGLAGAGESVTDDHTHEGLVGVVASHYVEPLVGVFTGADQPGRVTLAVVSKTLEIRALSLLTALPASDLRVEELANPISLPAEEPPEERDACPFSAGD
jgi:hypothetical protein